MNEEKVGYCYAECRNSWHSGGNYGSSICRNPKHHRSKNHLCAMCGRDPGDESMKMNDDGDLICIPCAAPEWWDGLKRRPVKLTKAELEEWKRNKEKGRSE